MSAEKLGIVTWFISALNRGVCLPVQLAIGLAA